MRRIERRPVHDFDWLFLGLVCLLLALGFVNLVSATLTAAMAEAPESRGPWRSLVNRM